MNTSSFLCLELFSLGSLYRTSTCAGTAVDASAGINNSLSIIQRDSTNGASVNASAAADTFFTDLVSHK